MPFFLVGHFAGDGQDGELFLPKPQFMMKGKSKT
jgi:hypothetical protein